MQASSKIQPQLSLGLAIDPGAIKSIELELDKIIAELQQKCKLTITVDTTQATKAVEKVASSRSGITKAISNAQRLLDDTRTKFAGLSYTDPKEVQELRDMIAVAQQLGKKGTAKDAADLADQTGIARRAIKALGNEFAALDRHKQTLANLRAALNMRGTSTSDLPAELQAYEKAISSFKPAAGVNGLAQLKQLQDAATGYVRAMQKAANAPAAKQSVFDAKKLNSFDTAAKNMEHTLANLSKQTGIEQTTKEYQRFVSLLQQVSQNGGAGFEKLREASISAQHSIQDLNRSLNDEATIQKNYNRNAGVLGSKDYFSRMGTRIGSFSNADQNIRTAAIEQLAKLEGAYNSAQANKTAEAMQKVNVEYQKFIQLLGQVSNSNSANNTLQRQQKSIESLTRQIQEYMAAFSNGLARNPQLRQKWDELLNKVTAPGSAANESALRTEFAKLSKESHQAGVEIETVGQRVRSLFGQHFNTALIMAALNGLRLAIRQLWQDIRDVNDALVQTQVVTGLTGAALENYTDRAYAAAARSRDTVVNILESATTFGRLGYDSDLSVQLAELTSMYSKLGDTDVSSATDAITAMMKAFRLEDASEIEAALDKLIYVGNNFPISAAGLGEGLNNAASALSSAGNSLEETLSLLMAANATVQNPAKASTAMRTITARIRNTTAKLDELGESLDEEYNTVAKYRAQLKGLSGVDILQADGKTFRSTYDILQDLSKAWQTLTDSQRAAITTMVAGTRNTDIFASLMQNFPEAEAAMAGMDDAAGLMDEKFTAVADSISGAISELSNAWSKFSTNLVESDDIVNLIRLLTNVVDVIDELRAIVGTGGLVGIASLIPVMTNSMQSLNFGQLRGLASMMDSGSMLNPAAWKEVTNAMQTLTPIQRQVVMNFSQMDRDAQNTFRQFASSQGVAVGLSGALDTLASSVDGVRYNFENFVASGNIYIVAAQAILTVILAIVNTVREQDRLTQLAIENAQKESRTLTRNTLSAINAYDDTEESVNGYIAKIEELSKVLVSASSDSGEYKKAMLDLSTINSQITSQFGEQAAVIKDVTHNLDEYIAVLNKAAARKKWDELLNVDNEKGLREALKFFGIDETGNHIEEQSPYVVNTGLEFSFKVPEYTPGTAWNDEANEYLRNLFGQAADYLQWDVDVFDRLINDGEPIELFANLENIAVRDTGKTIKVIELLADQWDRLKESGADGADIIRDYMQALKDSIGYSDVMALYDKWSPLSVMFSGTSFIDPTTKATVEYADALDAASSKLTKFQDATVQGNIVEAAQFLDEWNQELAWLADTAYENGVEYIGDYIDGMRAEVNRSQFVQDLMRQMSRGGNVDIGNRNKITPEAMVAAGWTGEMRNGKYEPWFADQNGNPLTDTYATLFTSTYGDEGIYMNFTPILPNGEVLSPSALEEYALGVVRGVHDDYLSLKVGRAYSSADEAGAAAYAYHQASAGFYEYGGGIASGYDASITPTISAMRGKTSTYKTFTGKDSTSEAIESVGKLQKAFDQFNEAKKVYDEMFAEDGSIINLDVSEENLDKLNEYMGTEFEEVTEENADAFKKAFEGASEETYAEAENMMADTLRVLQSGGVNVAEMVNADGTIALDQVSAALANLEQSADTASAAAATVAADNLKKLAGMRFSMVVDPATGDIKTVVDGGGTATTTPKKTGGGGGGGKSSKLSKAYQSDIEALDEIIDLWKKLLNYYDEGSDQWIKRQTDIIDKYKAGVEIAQTEYNRLIAKGLKQTDDDVKTLVDKILDYQDAIFQESENLWEAVRQNQIDAIQHTLDQNDAATQLEETHHDLVLAIRDERRELEDELKAARNAYSEVMTPQELDALFSPDDFAELMGKLADIEGDAMSMYRDYRSQIAAVSEDETYLIEHITDEFERQYELKMKEYEVAKQELAVARAQRELDNVREERNTAMLINGSWQWVADPAAVLEAENKLADAQQELADAQDEYDFQTLIKRMEAQSSELQKQIDALEALRFSMDELANQIHLFSDKVYKDLLTYLSATAQASFSKFEGSTAVPQFHTGGVVGKGGLAQLHDDEIIFNSADAAKLWRLVHNSPGVQVDTGAVLQGIAKLAVGKPTQATGSQAGSVSNVVQIGDLVIEGEKARQFIEVLRDVVAPYQPNNN